MINIERMPCSNCKNFCGVLQVNKEESTEHLGCNVAKDKKAENILKVNGQYVTCDKQEKYDDYE